MYDIVIIGGGASGLISAINAKKLNKSINVCILEALPKIGKKILATGNGRCNITNLFATSSSYNTDFTSNILEQYSSNDVISFFESISLKCFEELQGRIYPMSNTASTVLDCINNEIERLNIKVITNYKVEKLIKSNDIFIINNDIKAKSVLIATGGKSSPSQGSDGSGYNLLKGLGHKITNTYPGLVQLKIKEKVKLLKGIRVKANVRLFSNDKLIDSSSGEVLFTDYGLSGIAIMDISRSVKNLNCLCELDILPCLSCDEINNFIILNNENGIENVLSGMLPKKVSQYILQGLRIDLKKKTTELSAEEINNIVFRIKHLKFTITETLGFNNAQITVGGADTSQFNDTTLESKIVKNLYCSGEILDVDAACGGFNLQWAWASGLAVGENMAKTKGA